MEPTPTLIAAMLDLLKALGVNQNKVAARLQVTRGQVSQWRTGFRPIPASHFKALAELINSTYEHAMDADDNPTRRARIKWAMRDYQSHLMVAIERHSPGRGLRSLYADAENYGRVISDAMTRGPESWSGTDRTQVAVAARMLADLVVLMNILKPLEEKEERDAENADPC